jgi:hypothetical protein
MDIKMQNKLSIEREQLSIERAQFEEIERQKK